MITIISTPISRSELQHMAESSFGDFVKGVVDINRRILALGSELHADEEAALLEEGSRQEDLWGINLYPSMDPENMIEFDSMINIRPSQGNRSRSVENETVRRTITGVVTALIAL
jgi:hypothetical protein